MAVLKMSRRLIIAGGFALAVTAAPIVMATGVTVPASTHTLADSSSSSDASGMTSCSTKQDSGSYSMSCQLATPLPSGAAGGNGQLSEQTLTASNHH